MFIDDKDQIIGLRYEDCFNPITSYQLAQAFPDEADLAQKRVLALKRKVAFWRELVNETLSSDLPPEEKEFRLTWIELRMGYDPRIKEINLLERYLDHVKRPAFETIDLEKAKSVPIQEIVDLVHPKRTRRNVVACCPIHKEKTPSFYIYTDNNRFKCFGCGASGDAIQFYMDVFNVDFKTAVRRLTE